jgi:hypothetical protein
MLTEENLQGALILAQLRYRVPITANQGFFFLARPASYSPLTLPARRSLGVGGSLSKGRPETQPLANGNLPTKPAQLAIWLLYISRKYRPDVAITVVQYHPCGRRNMNHHYNEACMYKNSQNTLYSQHPSTGSG